MARILVLEDDADFADLVKLDLEQAGHKVDITDSGTSAFDLITETHYDLLIADIYIWKEGKVQPDGGLLLAGRLHRLRLTESSDPRGTMPIIVMTGAVNRPGQENILKVASSVGADAVLAKPFSSRDLHKTVHKLLTDHRPT
ncbi:MAG: response regulator [Rhodobacteraceae bacterium]|nr:response regulator [Paracoccaceae bacterium]